MSADEAYMCLEEYENRYRPEWQKKERKFETFRLPIWPSCNRPPEADMGLDESVQMKQRIWILFHLIFINLKIHK